MNDRKKWIVGFIVTLTFALIAGGASAIFRMDVLTLRAQALQLKEDLTRKQTEIDEGLSREDAMANQLKDLQDKLKEAQEELDDMALEMRSQKDRLAMDFQEQFRRERRKVQELKAINDRQREGNFNIRPGKGWVQSLESLKTENPERYQQIMEAKERHMQQERQQMARRNDFLDQLEKSELSDAKKEDVQRYRELTDRMWQYRQNFDKMSNEERVQFFRDNRESFKEMNDLQQVVRDELFDQAVKAGKTDQAKEIVDLFPSYGRRSRPTVKKQMRRDSRF